jgi:hypothetical protein
MINCQIFAPTIKPEVRNKLVAFYACYLRKRSTIFLSIYYYNYYKSILSFIIYLVLHDYDRLLQIICNYKENGFPSRRKFWWKEMILALFWCRFAYPLLIYWRRSFRCWNFVRGKKRLLTLCSKALTLSVRNKIILPSHGHLTGCFLWHGNKFLHLDKELCRNCDVNAVVTKLQIAAVNNFLYGTFLSANLLVRWKKNLILFLTTLLTSL